MQPDEAPPGRDKLARFLAILGCIISILSLGASSWSAYEAWVANKRAARKVEIVATRMPEVSFGEEDALFDALGHETIRSRWALTVFNLSDTSPVVVKSVAYKGCNDDGVCQVFHQPGAPIENYPDKIEPFAVKPGEQATKEFHVYIPMTSSMRMALRECKCQTYQALVNYMLSQGFDELGNTLIAQDPLSGINYGKPLHNLGVHVSARVLDEPRTFERMIGWKDERFDLDLPIPKTETSWALNQTMWCLPGQPPPRGFKCEK